MNWIDKALGVHPQVLTFRSQRSAVLAANIANADTPDYKARDVDFQSLLARAEAGRGVNLRATDARHIAPATQADDPGLLYRVPTRPLANGNSVESEVEQAAFAENALRYQASLEFVSGSLGGLLKAFKGE